MSIYVLSSILGVVVGVSCVLGFSLGVYLVRSALNIFR